MAHYDRDGRYSRHTSLLISLLVRYPEVASVRYNPRHQTVRMTLLLRGVLAEADFETLKRRLADTVVTYNQIQQRETAVVEIGREEMGDLTTVTVTRDVLTLTPEEIWTLVEFFRQWFPEQLVVEAVEYLGEEDLMAQEEMIEGLVAELSGGKPGRNLIAFRDGGRVMLFHK